MSPDKDERIPVWRGEYTLLCMLFAHVEAIRMDADERTRRGDPHALRDWNRLPNDVRLAYTTLRAYYGS